MAMTYEQVFAADPANPSNIAQNAAITIFAPGDVTMTPLTITDPDGQPLANPIPVNANGFGSAFAHATLDRVAWAGGGFTGFFTSYEGMKEVAVAAQAAAETAASDASAAAATTVTTATINGSGRLILTKADTTTVDAGPAVGPQGATGPTGPTGPTGSQGPAGVADDASVAAQVNNPVSTTRAALNATFVPGNPTLVVTYNGDGSVASTTENGVLTTFTYNPNGTVNTQTRAGVTKTFTYDSNGNVTGAA